MSRLIWKTVTFSADVEICCRSCRAEMTTKGKVTLGEETASVDTVPDCVDVYNVDVDIPEGWVWDCGHVYCSKECAQKWRVAL